MCGLGKCCVVCQFGIGPVAAAASELTWVVHLQFNMMAAQSIVCQAMPVTRPAPSKAAPQQTGPLARPAGGFSQVIAHLTIYI